MAEAEAPDRQMKRTLGPLALTCIGIGAVIGAGIFSLTGTAAAGQTFASGLETPVINFIQAWFSGTGAVLGRAGAGPAIAASFIVAGIGSLEANHIILRVEGAERFSPLSIPLLMAYAASGVIAM